MTGCPNGCARPYIAEIGLVGTAVGTYNLHLGGGPPGRTSQQDLPREPRTSQPSCRKLDGWLARYKSERTKGETFGDFTIREVKFKVNGPSSDFDILFFRHGPPTQETIEIMTPNKPVTAKESNKLFPVFLKLEHLRLLVVGGGAVGLEKLHAIVHNSPLPG